MKVSIVIPVKNQSESLYQCLLCLSRQTVKPSEIIVVDNDSSEDIYSICKEFGAVYEFESKPGSYAARNCGILRSSGDLIGFTDADCRPWATWISGALMAFEVYQYEAVAGHVNFTFSAAPVPIAEYIDSFSHLDQERYAKSNYGAGANLWIRRDVLNKVGGFRGDMMNLGDREWGERARGYGVAVTYSSLTTIDHPARNWDELLGKIWNQLEWKNFLTPFTWRDIFTASIVPWQNYRNAIFDPQLPGFRKVRYILALHWIGILQAYRIVQLVTR